LRWSRQRCAGHGLGLATPREHAQRGSQVCLTRDTGAYAIVQALIARGVIGDFRAGDGGQHRDILRFGFTPLYIGFEDVWNAVEHLRQVLDTGRMAAPRIQPEACGDLMGCPHHPASPPEPTGLPEAIVHDEKAKLDFSQT
jgi:hypothetical protein